MLYGQTRGHFNISNKMLNRNENNYLNSKTEAFKKKCREAGLNVTPQRTAIYKLLIQSTEHPSADMIYKQVKKEMPDISFDTVNRTLSSLCKVGLAYVVEGPGRAKRFEGNTENHQHFNCLKCGRVIDFHHEPFDKIEIPEEIEKKFKILRKSVYLEGLCDKCK